MPHLDIKIGELTFSYKRLDANEPWIGVVVVGGDGERGMLKLTTDEWNTLAAVERKLDEAALPLAQRLAHREMVKLLEFNSAYQRLSEEGACDSPGGGEYERVRAEWLAAGQPEIEPFIRERANWVPGAKQ